MRRASRVLLVVAALLAAASARAGEEKPIAVSPGDWWVYVEAPGRGTAGVWSYTVTSVEGDTIVIARTAIRDGTATDQPALTVQRSTLGTPEGLYAHAVGKDGSAFEMTVSAPVADALTLSGTKFSCERHELSIAPARSKGTAVTATIWTSPDVKTGPRLVKLETKRGPRTHVVTLAGYGTKAGTTWGVRAPVLPAKEKD